MPARIASAELCPSSCCGNHRRRRVAAPHTSCWRELCELPRCECIGAGGGSRYPPSGPSPLCCDGSAAAPAWPARGDVASSRQWPPAACAVGPACCPGEPRPPWPSRPLPLLAALLSLHTAAILIAHSAWGWPRVCWMNAQGAPKRWNPDWQLCRPHHARFASGEIRVRLPTQHSTA